MRVVCFLLNSCSGVTWNGTRFVVTGEGTNTLACTTDGVAWTGLGTGALTVAGYNAGGNNGAFATPSHLLLDGSSGALNSTLDVVGEVYNNPGYMNFSTTIKSTEV